MGRKRGAVHFKPRLCNNEDSPQAFCFLQYIYFLLICVSYKPDCSFIERLSKPVAGAVRGHRQRLKSLSTAAPLSHTHTRVTGLNRAVGRRSPLAISFHFTSYYLSTWEVASVNLQQLCDPVHEKWALFRPLQSDVRLPGHIRPAWRVVLTSIFTRVLMSVH